MFRQDNPVHYAAFVAGRNLVKLAAALKNNKMYSAADAGHVYAGEICGPSQLVKFLELRKVKRDELVDRFTLPPSER